MASKTGSKPVPFVNGVPVSGDHFVGREKILNEIGMLVDGARDGAINHMLLLGLRRMGKSSILLSVKKSLDGDKKIIPITVNAAGIPTRQVFARVYMRAVLDGYLSKTGNRSLLKKIKAGIKEGLKNAGEWADQVDVSVGEYVKFSIMLSRKECDEEEIIEQALGYPEALGSDDGTLFVIMIDEFQDLLKFGSQFLSTMRRVIQEQKSVTYILAGSAPSAMRDMAYNPNAPFYRQLYEIRVPPLPADDVVKFLKKRFDVAGVNVGQDVLEDIWGRSQGFPDYVQRLALRALARCRESGRRSISASDVEAAYADMIAMLGFDFESQFRGFSERERDVLIAMANSCNGVSSIANRINAAPTSIPMTLRRLISKDMVRKHMEHRYMIVDHVFADWLRSRFGSELPWGK